MPAASICYAPACGHRAAGQVRDCPRCGSRMRTPSTVRRLGLLMLLRGIFLTGFMGVITFNMTPMLLHPGQEVYGGGRFTGDADQARMVLQIFWPVMALGVAAMTAGTWQMVTARRDRLVTLGILALAAVLFLAARGTMTALS